MPAEVLRLAKNGVASGRARSLSLDAMDIEHGKPTKAATAWARRVIKRSS